MNLCKKRVWPSCPLISVCNFVNHWSTTLIYLKSLHLCVFSTAWPSLHLHITKSDNVFYYKCVRGGEEPSPLAGPMFRFLISSVVFFFPSKPGSSCRGNDNMRGKQINNISSHIVTLPTRSPVSHFMYPKLPFSVHVPFDFPPHFYLFLLQDYGPWPMKLIQNSFLLKLKRLTIFQI